MHFLARSNVPRFSSKKESVIILKKKEVYVSYEARNYRYSTLCELSGRTFRMAKIKHGNKNF